MSLKLGKWYALWNKEGVRHRPWVLNAQDCTFVFSKQHSHCVHNRSVILRYNITSCCCLISNIVVQVVQARRPSDMLRVVLRGTLEAYSKHERQAQAELQGPPVRMHRSFGELLETYQAREPIGEDLLEGGHLQPTTLVGGKSGLLLALHGCDFR